MRRERLGEKKLTKKGGVKEKEGLQNWLTVTQRNAPLPMDDAEPVYGQGSLPEIEPRGFFDGNPGRQVDCCEAGFRCWGDGVSFSRFSEGRGSWIAT